ncbi:hypothetical protein HNY73_003158 [Argiope bruennichi]|uniref:Uncharacterized protein n=1 Tax=Argiope bruennichi TaxID=94029 RepID=A0A8T0G030_ARGBR|nr:hypothetical protein HNY73_003158 [Argiope bruennichi]
MRDRFTEKFEPFKTNKSTLAFIVSPLNTNTNEINIEPFGMDAGSLQMKLLDLETKDLWSGKFTEFKSKLEESEVHGIIFQNVTPVDQELLCHDFWGQTKQKSHNMYNITLQSLCSNFRHNISVLDEKRICGAIPRVSNPEIFPILKRKNVELGDTGEDTPEIDLLTGADYLSALLTGSIEHIDKNLVAIKTAAFGNPSVSEKSFL